MKKARALLATCAALVFAVGLAGVGHAITNGQLDGNLHPYVGLVDNGVFTCSGAALSSTVVVTAAHCLWPWQAGGSGPVNVTFDTDASGTPRFYAGTIYTNPDWCIACQHGVPGFDTHDIAVVVLDDTGVSLAEYAVLPTEGLVDTLPMKTALTVVGYGYQGYSRGGGKPAPMKDFKRYYAATELVASENRKSDEYLKLTANPAQGKGGVCIGDSGGPALLGNVVLGITSYLPNSECVGVTYSNRLDLQYALDFVNGF